MSNKRFKMFVGNIMLAVLAYGCDKTDSANVSPNINSANASISNNANAAPSVNPATVIGDAGKVNTDNVVPPNSVPPPAMPITTPDENSRTEATTKIKAPGKQNSNMPERKIGSGPGDFYLYTKVRPALEASADLKDTQIIVNVSNSNVTLTGTVANSTQKNKAEQIAKGIEGVKSVSNQLRASESGSKR